jgi:uncharacterized membrane protein
MTVQLALSIALHQLATVIWIGGMFFAHFALRQSAQRELEPPQRLPFLLAVFRRFFAWVWIAVVVLWGSGAWILLGVYDGAAGWHVHLMIALALIMTVLFGYVYFVPYRKLGQRIAVEDWTGATRGVATIRRIILINLGLGIVTAMIGSAGRYLQ